MGDLLFNGNLEIYIQHQAATIFYYNLNEPLQKNPAVDKQLISGFLNATTLFFENLGFKTKSNIFRIIRGNVEIRMVLGTLIHGTLVLENFGDLSNLAYTQLDEMVKAIIKEFQKNYSKEIKLYIDSGEMHFKGIDKFILNEVQRIKTHVYSSYLLRILGLSINRNVKREKATNLIIDINQLFQTKLDFYTIYMELDTIRQTIEQFQQNDVSIMIVIRKVNKESKKLWDVFKIPTIPLLDSE